MDDKFFYKVFQDKDSKRYCAERFNYFDDRDFSFCINCQELDKLADRLSKHLKLLIEKQIPFQVTYDLEK